MPIGKEEIQHRFGYHPSTDVTASKHEHVREAFIGLSLFLDGTVPDGDAKEIAFKKLQEAAMWSNFAVAELAPLFTHIKPPQPTIPGVD